MNNGVEEAKGAREEKLIEDATEGEHVALVRRPLLLA